MTHSKFVLLLAALLVSAGCSNSVEVRVQGTPEMNDGGNAAVVKIYQLSGEARFTETPLSAFWRDDDSALGSELVTSPSRLTIYPAHSRTVEIELAESTAFLGVAANLREPDRQTWRSLHPVDGMGDEVLVRVQSSGIAVDVEERRLSVPKVDLDGR